MSEHGVIVDSEAHPLKEIFGAKYSVGYYQREYVWQRKQLEDLIIDLSSEFLKNWKSGDSTAAVRTYHPYFMGEIVLSVKGDELSDIIDGQQRITTLTLLLIYLMHRFGNRSTFPKSDVERLIYSNDLGTNRYNLDIEERRACMDALYKNGEYQAMASDSISVHTILERYADIDECWNPLIGESNVDHFVYWMMEKVIFSKVWTNSDEFAYVIFETMNDRGLSLTQVEMLRSYILANVGDVNRGRAMRIFDGVVKRLMDIKLSSKSKAEFEFFKIYLRGHYAQDFSQAKNSNSDFVRIGKEFHRWVRDNERLLGLNSPSDFISFLDRIDYFSSVYEKINSILSSRDAVNYLYLIANGDYGFTLQPALILASVKYQDAEEVVLQKIKIVSKHLAKMLSWRVWNQTMISQSAMEAPIYDLCQRIRGKSAEELETFLKTVECGCDGLQAGPVLNQQNKRRFKVLIALITEIVAKESGQSDYMLNRPNIEVEHIWADHFDRHVDEFQNEQEFSTARDTIGDLLVLPKSFNASYGDAEYEVKLPQYFSQNILAQSLHEKKYVNNPGFVQFVTRSGLAFKPYAKFVHSSILERTELYKSILLWNWR